MYRITFFFILLVFSGPAFPQTGRLNTYKQKLNQLAREAPAPEADRERLQVLTEICKERYSLNGDTLCFYSRQAIELAEKLKDIPAYYNACNNYAWGLSMKGDLDSCEKYTQRYVELLAGKPEYREQYTRFRITAANNHYKSSKAKVSLKSMYELLREVEDRTFRTDILNEIAVSYGGMEHFEEEIEWADRALALNRNPQTVEEKCAYVRSLSNKSIAYIHLYERTHSKALADSTFKFAGMTEAFAEKNEILFFFCQGVILKGYYYSHTGNPREAEKYLKKGLEIRKITNEPIYVVSDMTVLGTFYAKTGQPDKGIDICLEALDICEERKLGLMVVTLVYKALCQNYEAAGMHREYSNTLNILLKLKDSLYLKNLDGELEKLDAVYNLQKQEIELARKEASLDKKNFQFYTILITVAFLAISAGIWFNGYKKNQKLHLHFVQEEEKRKAELAVKEAEEKERKRLAADLHDHLGVQANVILHTAEQLRSEVDPGLIGHLNDSAKDMLFFLRETLWALKSSDVSAENTWLRILNFMTRMKRTYTNVRFEINGTPPAGLLLSSAKALNILMITQEAVNNAVRHSRGTLIRIVSESNEAYWRLAVTDNGTGFSPERVKGESYGLANMKQRAESSGFRFNLSSREGTQAVIEIPLG